MRTTLRLDDALLARVRMEAARRGATLTSVIEDALRELLARGERPEDEGAFALPTFRGKGVQPGVDLDDTSSLLDLMAGADETP